jgi:hypothetical protein
MKIEDRIEKLEKELADLKLEVEKENKFKFFPQEGDIYWYFTNTGPNISKVKARYTNEELNQIGYKTKEEAEKARDIAIAKNKLKQIIEWKNDGWKPDWNNYNQTKLMFERHKKTVYIDVFTETKCQPDWMYMKDTNTAKWVLERHKNLVEIVLGE